MEFRYSYKTSDGVRHEDRITAPSRDEAFAVLRNRGIRPIKVIACDGSKENGARSGQDGGRKLVLLLAAALLLAVAYSVFNMNAGDEKNPTKPKSKRAIESNVVEIKPEDRIAKPRPRKQLSNQISDPSSFFLHESEAYLVRYAQPGRISDRKEFTESLKEDLLDSLEDIIVITPDDPREVAELKHIVAGLKEEASMILNGGKSVTDLIAWFDERQKMEADYRMRIIQSSATEEEKERMLLALSLPLQL